MLKFLLPVLFILPAIPAAAQQPVPYKNPDLPIEQRVADLLARMTPEEKFWQLFMIPGDLDNRQPAQYRHSLFGLQVSASGGNPNNQILQYNTSEPAAALARKINAIQKYFVEETRLGIPLIPFDEALHGLVRAGATAFPQAIALSATWDTALVHRAAATIAAECRQRGIRQILSPVVNLATDVRWGRTEETYGEDPFLASAMGVSFVSAFEKENIITTPKHFIANVGEGGRDSYPIEMSERQLREQHLPPFAACFTKGGSRSVMAAYNSYNGSPASASRFLLTDLLKKQLSFTGFSISDANGVGGANVLHFTAKDYAAASANAINAGLDVIFQTDYEHYKLFQPPFLDGRISTERINDAVSRVLRAKFALGLFEQPYIPEPVPASSFPQKQLAKQVAAASFVLLKNESNRLPLPRSVKKIALIGEDAVNARLGGYSGSGNGVVNILTGLQHFTGKQTQILYEPGCGLNNDSVTVLPALGEGFAAEYFNNIYLQGEPAFRRNDKQIDFHWTLYGPDDTKVPVNHFSVRWKGKFRVPRSGQYTIGLEGNDGYRLYINDQRVIDRWQKTTDQRVMKKMYFEKDREYVLRIEFYEPSGNGRIRLLWNDGRTDSGTQKIAAAVSAARKADVAVIVAGIKEGEFQDRAKLQLPGRQEEMIHHIAETGKPVVVLLVAGSAVITENWLNRVDAVMQIWYPGEEGGNAVAETLFGVQNPAGRLPFSVPKHEGQLPLVYNHKPTGRGDDYNDLSGAPAFPFGFGLSYTQFAYSGLRFSKTNFTAADTVWVYARIKNTGTRAGSEIVQLYLRDELSTVVQPVTALKGFLRVELLPGEEKEIGIPLPPEAFKLYNEKMEWIMEPGTFRVMLGASSKDIRLQGTVHGEK